MTMCFAPFLFFAQDFFVDQNKRIGVLKLALAKH